jgi:transposase
MVIIGVDPHKRTHTASALEPGSHRVLATLQVDATLGGYRQLSRWAARFEVRRWAVENARGLGRHLAQWLAARGEQVDDVPCAATARVRELSRGGRRKNDVIDAAAAASVAALAGDARPVAVEDLSTVLALLDERRANLAAHRTRLINQLHALLRDLIPGGVPTDLTAAGAARVLAGVRPVGPVEAARKQLGRDLVTEVRDVDTRLAKLTVQMSQTVAEHGSRLPEVDGIGPVVATRLLGRTGRASRFPSSSAFANYAGVAPVEVASADRARHRLPRGGDRQLNLALHIAALTQVRMRASAGRAYYDRKITEGKTHNEAMRCLKRRLADHVWRIMIADERRKARAASPGGQPGATLTSSATGSTPNTSSSDKSLPGPADCQHRTSDPAA